MKNISAILFLLCFITPLMASVTSRTNSGIQKSWNGVALTILNIYTPSYNASNYGNADLVSAVNSAADSWSARGGMVVLARESTDSPSTGKNDIYFSSSYEGLGSGVLGVTVTTTDEISGSITEGDIIINSSYTYSANQLYDVITHEMGHFLGLGHSPVEGATMHYQWVSGQRELALDDITGIAGKYPKNSNLTGTISGRVIGGTNGSSIFGAHVHAISEEFGQVMGTAITEQDGTFHIKGLLTNRTYYIYIAPLKEFTSLPSYFSSVENNFCGENSDYVGGFFEGCSKSYEGHPQPVYLASSTNIGDVTIHCGLKVPNDYYLAKSEGMELMNDEQSPFGDSTVGYFTSSEVNGQDSDSYLLDLTDRSDLLGKTLTINIMSRSLLNSLYFRAQIIDAHTVIRDEEYSPLSDGSDITRGDVQLKVTLSSVASENLFYVKVTAISGSIFNLSGAYWSVADIRPFYFMNIYFSDGGTPALDVSTTVLGGGNTRVRLEDEYACPEGENVHSYFAEVDLSSLEQANNNDNLPILSCATIDTGSNSSGPGGGLGSVVVGFSLIMLLSLFQRHKMVLSKWF